MRKPIKAYRGKRASRPAHWYFIFGGLSLGLVALIAARFVRSIGFLITIVALLCFFMAFCGLLWLPWQHKRLRAAARALRVITVVLAAAGLISFVAIEAKIISYGSGSPDPEARCVIVLGAGLYGDRPSLVLESRLRLAYQYMTENPDCVAIVSGGQGPGETIPEALAMERDLISRGIDAARIFQEDQSSSTAQNLTFSKEIMLREGLPLDSVVIISNSFHLYRAERLAAQLGITATTLGAAVPPVHLTPLNSYVREYFSVVKMFFASWLQ